MGIIPNQYPVIWQAIRWWMEKKLWDSAELALQTGYSKARIERGIRGEPEPPTSDFLHSCVDVFGLRASRQRGIEETADVLTDEECVYLLTEPLRIHVRQASLWDNLQE